MSDVKPQETLLDTILATIPPIHKEGWKFVGIFAVSALILGAIHCYLGIIGWLATAWCAYFFRDPPRVTPTRIGLIISPGDGKISKIATVVPPAELGLGDTPRVRVSIFLNVFDVHINRIPVDGVISTLHYRPGAFVNAALDKASEDNERQLVRITMDIGMDIGVVQIAGWVARRIVCWLKSDQRVKGGERFGLIRFGSRVDLYLPPGASPQVIEGQYVLGGETVMADLGNSEPARQGVVR